MQLERPRSPEHGDLTTNLALVLTRPAGPSLHAPAERIATAVDLAAVGVSGAEVAGRPLREEPGPATAGLVDSRYHAGNPSRNPEPAALVPDGNLRRARLAPAHGVAIVLENGSSLLGLTAPERMEREGSA